MLSSSPDYPRKRVALVTGGRQNIGLAIVRQLIDDGFVVAVHSRSADKVRPVVASLNSEFGAGSAIAATCDVSMADDVDAMFERLRGEVGGVHALVHNTTVRVRGSVDVVTADDWDRTLATVMTGAFNCVRAALPTMRARGWGRIVTIGGYAGERGLAHNSVGSAAKAGLIGFCKALGLELGPLGITVNVVSPGSIDSQREPPRGQVGEADEYFEAIRSRAHIDIPVGRLGTPSDIAHACSYLCSDRAGFVTGHVLSINGGFYT